MANNHMGDVEHGIRIIREFHAALKDLPVRVAMKFQYRYIDSFVHPAYRNRTDIKLIKRFTETMLSEADYLRLTSEVKSLGWSTVCTPFDEKSVALIEAHQHDVIKIPSCYFSDWPLLERVAQSKLPIIASTAGASVEEMDRVVSFFQHRDKNFAIMHCVAEYPTPDQDLQLNQIDIMRRRYATQLIGFSTHESPDNMASVQIAAAKGAALFEKHVAVPTDKYAINAYSATPAQARAWVQAALKAWEMGGVVDQPKPIPEKEKADLRALYRGVWAKKPIQVGEALTAENTFYAMPNVEDQLIGQDMSKYSQYVATKAIDLNEPCLTADFKHTELREWVQQTVRSVRALLQKANVRLPNKVEVELSHHHGQERFAEWGATILNVVNREYCKKIIVLLPGQQYPVHHHKAKDETLHVLHGKLELVLGETKETLKEGDVFPVERNADHSFASDVGCVFEEISTTYLKGDSYYEPEIYNNPRRKTYLTYWSDWAET